MISVRRFLSWLPYFFLLFLPLAHFRGHCTPTLSFRLFPFPATGLNGLFMVVWPCGCLLVPFSTFRSATAVGWTGIYPLFAFFTMDVAVRRVLYTPAATKLWKHVVNFDFCIFLARSANFNTPVKKFWSVPSSFFFKDSTIWSRSIPHSSTVTRSCGSFLAGKPAEGKSVFSIASSSNSSEEHCYSLTSGKLMTRSCKPSYELRGKDTPKTNKDKYIN